MMRRGLSSLVSSLSLVGVMGVALAAAVEAADRTKKHTWM